MKRLMCVVLCVSLGMVLCGTARAEMLVDPGFEGGTFSGEIHPPWMGVPPYPAATVGAETWAARTDTYGMAVYWWNNGGTGYFYQDVAVSAGTSYDFSIYGTRDPGAQTGTIDMSIGWYQGATLLGTTSLDITNLIGIEDHVLWIPNWTQVGLTGVAPTGSDMARAMISATTVTQALKFDDASFVPEPATMALLGLGSLFLARRRK